LPSWRARQRATNRRNGFGRSRRQGTRYCAARKLCWRYMGAAYERRNYRLTNPSDGSELAYIALGAAADIDQAVAAVQAAQAGDRGALTPVERGRILVRMPRIVTERADATGRARRRPAAQAGAG
jgi:acyl-CoA reductase-like NAD-dependent aldehyde dehydrogenase